MGKRILVVEDEVIVREALQEWLTEEGYEVEVVGDGNRALEAIDNRDFGLVILDLKLPEKDGLKVFREAKARRPELLGVIITAYPSAKTAAEAMQLGILNYLPKPIDLQVLNQILRKTLGPPHPDS